jgi:GNAT superfamily N-acetyltransferase
MSEIVGEFTEAIYSPNVRSISELSHLSTDEYWVACRNDKVIGTVGYTLFADSSIALKRMFLAKAFRGQGVAEALLEAVIGSAIKCKASTIYLGTMKQFRAAQNFYEKKGFTRIADEDLPPGFPANPVDKVFYRKEISG